MKRVTPVAPLTEQGAGDNGRMSCDSKEQGASVARPAGYVSRAGVTGEKGNMKRWATSYAIAAATAAGLIAFSVASVQASDSLDLFDDALAKPVDVTLDVGAEAPDLIDLQLSEPLVAPWPTLEPVPEAASLGLTDAIKLTDTQSLDDQPSLKALRSQQDGLLHLQSPVRTQTGVRLGMEISLDDSDQIELTETDRLFVDTEFGQAGSLLTGLSDPARGFLARSLVPRPSFGSSSLASSSLGPSSLASGPFDPVSVMTTASMLSLTAPQTALLNQNPSAFAPTYGGVRLGFANADPFALDPADRGFNIAIMSTFMANQPADTLSFFDAAPLDTLGRSYAVGLNMGFRGFTFAASFLRGNQVFGSYESYDVGLSYDFGRWDANLSLGGYFADHTDSGGLGLLTAVDIDRLYSVELGASYSIRPWLTVSGSLRFFDYSTLLGTDLDGLGGSVFLGTGLSF